jgi:hypothetical protein
MPIHYQPFPGGHYDPYGYAAAAAAAASNGQMMPQAYMVPAAIQQMYPTNPPVLSYQAAMSMISPQHQQAPAHGGYRPVAIQPQPSADANANTNTANATGTPAESTPATGEATTATTTTGAAASTTEDDDDEGSKLTILSKLCSEVLDRNDAPKQDSTEEPKTDESQQTTQTSQDNNNNAGVAVTGPTESTANEAADSDAAYGTPSESPTPTGEVKVETVTSEEQKQ